MLAQFSDATYLAFSNPWSRPLNRLGLELLVATCFALTVHHAWSRYRRGERYHLFQFLVIFSYGLMMELLAFNYFQNYEHAQFSVQLYHRKLPLYVTFVYPVFHYTGLKVIERLKLRLLLEALLVGFATMLIDLPFDIVGPGARWWVWSASDRNLAYRWLGVPVTSYYWYLIFGAVLAVLCRTLRRRIERRPLIVYLAFAPLIGAAVVVLGIVCFLPFHGLKALGVSDGVVVAAHLAACSVLALLARRSAAPSIDWESRAIVSAFYAFHVSVLLLSWSERDMTQWFTKLVVIVLGLFGMTLLCSARPLAWGNRANTADRGTAARSIRAHTD